MADSCPCVLNAIRCARKAKTPAQKAEHVRAAQDQLRSISPRKHPELVSAIQAKLLALQGRGGDTEIAHVTPGEVVIPRNLQTPAVMRTLAAAATRAGIDPRRYTVGHRANSVNPKTGAGEFLSPPSGVPNHTFTFITRRPQLPQPSWMDNIEAGIAKAIQFLRDLGFEIMPDGTLKGPNGEIIPFGTQIIEAASPTRRRPRGPDNQDSPGLREELRQNAQDLIQNLTNNAFTQDELERIANSIESNFRYINPFEMISILQTLIQIQTRLS